MATPETVSLLSKCRVSFDNRNREIRNGKSAKKYFRGGKRITRVATCNLPEIKEKLGNGRSIILRMGYFFLNIGNGSFLFVRGNYPRDNYFERT